MKKHWYWAGFGINAQDVAGSDWITVRCGFFEIGRVWDTFKGWQFWFGWNID